MEISRGCTATIINRLEKDNGKIVRVLKFLGAVPGWIGKDRWEIDTPVTVFSPVDYEPRPYTAHHVQARHLLVMEEKLPEGVEGFE